MNVNLLYRMADCDRQSMDAKTAEEEATVAAERIYLAIRIES